MLGSGLDLVWDFRDSLLRPFWGGLVRAMGEALLSPGEGSGGTRFGYTRYSLDTQFFIPVYRPHRVIVLRQTLRRVDPLGGREVPFYELPVLDFQHLLRSFERNRFQDRGVLSLNIEYRYPIWVTWDAYLFFDAGQSFEHYADLRSSEFRFSQGGGIRFMTKDALLFSVQVGVGREGAQSYVSLRQVF